MKDVQACARLRAIEINAGESPAEYKAFADTVQKGTKFKGTFKNRTLNVTIPGSLPIYKKTLEQIAKNLKTLKGAEIKTNNVSDMSGAVGTLWTLRFQGKPYWKVTLAASHLGMTLWIRPVK